MMECWYTKAERLPAKEQEGPSEQGFPRVSPSPIHGAEDHAPEARRLVSLTKVGLLIRSFQVYPFG